MTAGATGTGRAPERLLGCWMMVRPRTVVIDCRTRNTPCSQSTSCQRKPNTSPRRIPVARNTIHTGPYALPPATSREQRASSPVQVCISSRGTRGGVTASATLRGARPTLASAPSIEPDGGAGDRVVPQQSSSRSRRATPSSLAGQWGNGNKSGPSFSSRPEARSRDGREAPRGLSASSSGPSASTRLWWGCNYAGWITIVAV